MRTPIMAGNWKMNMTHTEAAELITKLAPLVAGSTCEIIVCPPAVDLGTVAEKAAGTNIGLGAQNVHWEEKGAYTGEISAKMLTSIGAKYAIIGHSERRQYFGETDDTVNKRALFAIKGGLTPIICVGETLEQRNANETETHIKKQVTVALREMSAEQVACIIIAYEPIWAIGTGVTASPEDAENTISMIRKTVCELYGNATAEAVRILYGGSMKPENSDELMSMPSIDGGLIGGASLKADSFAALCASADRTMK